MLVEFLQKNNFFRKIIYKLGRHRARDMVRQTEQYLDEHDDILDIGAGTCNLCEILNEKQLKVTPLDIKNLSFVDKIKPIIYDGNKIPFEDNKFDVALILTVLHHTLRPEETIKEAKRVSKRMVIFEDIYTNIIHKYLTYFMDSLFNLEFTGHPHSNKNDKEWRLLFNNLGLKLKDAKYSSSFLIFKHATYYLEK